MSTYDTYTDRMDPTPKIQKRSGPFHPSEPLKSVADALAFCEERGLDPAEVRLAHNYVSWESAETPEEVARRIQWATDRQAEHLASIKRIHDEYMARGLYDTTPEEPS